MQNLDKYLSLDLVALNKVAQDLAVRINSGDRILIEGALGAGKTAFTELILINLGLNEDLFQGSPTYPIAQEYLINHKKIVHLDLYRLKSEIELDEAGISNYFTDADTIIICEWISLFPEFKKKITPHKNSIFEVTILFNEINKETRDIEIIEN